MVWIFTCSTKDCENNLNPVNICNVVNPVFCSFCGQYTNAVETETPCPVAE